MIQKLDLMLELLVWFFGKALWKVLQLTVHISGIEGNSILPSFVGGQTHQSWRKRHCQEAA